MQIHVLHAQSPDLGTEVDVANAQTSWTLEEPRWGGLRCVGAFPAWCQRSVKPEPSATREYETIRKNRMHLNRDMICYEALMHPEIKV